MKRQRLDKVAGGGDDAAPKHHRNKTLDGGNYFATPKTHLSFVKSGCTTLDLALGGGWAEGRIFNIVGDKSTGKTLLCIEAAANFAIRYPKGIIRYAECEAAFDPQYAEALGMPLNRVDFGEPLETVEDLFEELSGLVKVKRPTLYICDSLDALSDRSEMDRDIDEGSFGAAKAKQMSQLFRRLVRRMGDSRLTLGIVSQVRDNIGARFGRKWKRSGGRALDFYASQVIYLAHLGSEAKKIQGVSRPFAINVRAKVDKNKVGLPFREADFAIHFGYGVDDARACLTWLAQTGHIKEVGVSKDEAEIKKYCNALMKKNADEFEATMAAIREATTRHWYEIETTMLPKRKKYA